VTEKTGNDEEFAAHLRRQICAAFDVKPWQIGIAPVPWHMRPLRAFRRLQWRWRLRRGT
jgi:hypothetical protein